MDINNIVRMANQIASFYKSYPHDEAVKETADHINRFWEPRMRRTFFEHMAKGGDGLDALVKEAALQVKKPKPEAA